jgi:hypothetical protein
VHVRRIQRQKWLLEKLEAEVYGNHKTFKWHHEKELHTMVVLRRPTEHTLKKLLPYICQNLISVEVCRIHPLLYALTEENLSLDLRFAQLWLWGVLSSGILDYTEDGSLKTYPWRLPLIIVALSSSCQYTKIFSMAVSLQLTFQGYAEFYKFAGSLYNKKIYNLQTACWSTECVIQFQFIKLCVNKKKSRVTPVFFFCEAGPSLN